MMLYLIAAESTYGKGKIQSVFELADGSAVFVTVAKYKTPAGSGELCGRRLLNAA